MSGGSLQWNNYSLQVPCRRHRLGKMKRNGLSWWRFSIASARHSLLSLHASGSLALAAALVGGLAIPLLFHPSTNTKAVYIGKTVKFRKKLKIGNNNNKNYKLRRCCSTRTRDTKEH